MKPVVDQFAAVWIVTMDVGAFFYQMFVVVVLCYESVSVCGTMPHIQNIHFGCVRLEVPERTHAMGFEELILRTGILRVLLLFPQVREPVCGSRAVDRRGSGTNQRSDPTFKQVHRLVLRSANSATNSVTPLGTMNSYAWP